MQSWGNLFTFTNWAFFSWVAFWKSPKWGSQFSLEFHHPRIASCKELKSPLGLTHLNKFCISAIDDDLIHLALALALALALDVDDTNKVMRCPIVPTDSESAELVSKQARNLSGDEINS